tara:strand:- start:1348 stop:1803 length:456 start_codon:yes stop_codon:yes gene_type:complete
MWISILGKAIGDLFGIGRDALNNRAKMKQLQADQKHEIIKAETTAEVSRILKNNDTDNSIDLITARQKGKSWKDEILSYLFLVPIFSINLVPFIKAFRTGEWERLNIYIEESYNTLANLPEFYIYILFLIVIDILGFRSFFRGLVEKWIKK